MHLWSALLSLSQMANERKATGGGESGGESGGGKVEGEVEKVRGKENPKVAL